MTVIHDIKEDYANTKTLKLLTKERLNIPGLHLFGHQTLVAAIDSLPPHHHGNKFEIVYVLSGNPSFFVSNRIYTLTGGDIFITRPHEMHSTDSRPISVCEMYWLQIDLTACSDSLFMAEEAVQALRERLENLTTPVISTDQSHMKRLIQSAFRTALSEQDPYLTAQYLSLFLYRISEYAEKRAVEITPDIRAAVDYIMEQVTRPITLEELAKVSFLSVSQFKQKFKLQLGIAPHQFINIQKTEYAKKLLEQGYSVAETAAILHFDSPSYFITVFKRYTSCTPGDYKKQCSAAD